MKNVREIVKYIDRQKDKYKERHIDEGKWNMTKL